MSPLPLLATVLPSSREGWHAGELPGAQGSTWPDKVLEVPESQERGCSVGRCEKRLGSVALETRKHCHSVGQGWTQRGEARRKTACLKGPPGRTLGGSSGVWAAVLASWGSERRWMDESKCPVLPTSPHRPNRSAKSSQLIPKSRQARNWPSSPKLSCCKGSPSPTHTAWSAVHVSDGAGAPLLTPGEAPPGTRRIPRLSREVSTKSDRQRFQSTPLTGQRRK